MVGIGLTREFDENFLTNAMPSTAPSGPMLGQGGTPRYDLALLDTGAGVSLLSSAGDAGFGIGSPFSGEAEGFRGTVPITLGGATGLIEAIINDPLGLYAGGLQGRTSAGATLGMNNAALRGQTNTSLITLPPESDLPNVLGLPFASQYATRILGSQPQVFELAGETVRTPAIEFVPRGSGATYGITRKAPMSLNPGASFQQAPFYFYNLENFNLDKPYEDPSLPTVVQGGLFLNVSVANDGANLSNSQFFFDTGASVTVLSQLSALQLGFDVLTDTPEFTAAVVGSGGIVNNIPGFFVDQFTIVALGGNVTLSNVPVIVLDVTNPADTGNVVPGIVGTNLLAGRDLVIDPNPSVGGGGASAGVYISDPVTTTHNWSSTAPSAAWTTAGSWSTGAPPTLLGVANVRRVAGAAQVATVAGNVSANEVNVSGVPGGTMTLQLSAGAKLTVFSGLNIEGQGTVDLQDATLDVQYIDLKPGGVLTGDGVVRTGSGTIEGQVENNGGGVAPGNAAGVGGLLIEGRFANNPQGTLRFTLGGTLPLTQYSQLEVQGSAAWDGTLQVNLAGGFAPTAGDSFVLATYEQAGGTFDTLTLPAGFNWKLDYGDSALVLSVAIEGDFNRDGLVDAADYTVWRDGLGTLYTQADYTVWKNNFGAGGAHGGAVAGVPEPAGLAIAALLAAALAGVTWPSNVTQTR